MVKGSAFGKKISTLVSEKAAKAQSSGWKGHGGSRRAAVWHSGGCCAESAQWHVPES